MRVAKAIALISFEVTAKLICVFVFAYANCWFSHEASQMLSHDHVVIPVIIRDSSKQNLLSANETRHDTVEHD